MAVWTISLTEAEEEKIKELIDAKEISDDDEMSYFISVILDSL